MACLLFDDMTSLDWIGFFEAVTRLRLMEGGESVSWDFCAVKDTVADDRGVTYRANRIRPDLAGCDLVFVPGGMATRTLRHDDAFLRRLRTAEPAEWKVSVCTGALLLGAAVFLQGKKAVTNASAFDLPAPYCAEVVKARVVRNGQVITGAGVSASIDTGLYVVERLKGPRSGGDDPSADGVSLVPRVRRFRHLPGGILNPMWPRQNFPARTAKKNGESAEPSPSPLHLYG
ncbi:DJ-1/PfpI family protein [Thermobacillus sp. ZCTH02-B1]|uniref:DJ-1/PfpI family protein n=1 Tax=Thermobacillus sp. ZCTH02-B1 TaxID=1858795 RepID=UPI00345D0581